LTPSRPGLQSCLDCRFLLDQCHDLAKIIDDGLQFCDGLGGEVLWFWEFVAVFERLVFQPCDIQLVAALLDLLNGEVSEATLRALVVSLAAAVGIGTVALLEFGEVSAGERAFFLGDAGDVGAGIEDPSLFSGQTFLQMTTLALTPWL
jgi:hypothetical protein